MRYPAGLILAVALLASIFLIAFPAVAQQPCEELMSVKITNVTIS